MNYSYMIDSYYIAPDETVEVILLTSINKTCILSNVVYVYNEQGLYFSLYDSFTEVIDRISGESAKAIMEFEDEIDLMHYLKRRYKLKEYK
jgi:hypothetical protein